MLQVAEWWSESPDTVGAWGCRKFADRQEYMFLQVEKKLDIRSSTPNQIPLEPGEVPYTGPKNRK